MYLFDTMLTMGAPVCVFALLACSQASPTKAPPDAMAAGGVGGAGAVASVGSVGGSVASSVVASTAASSSTGPHCMTSCCHTFEDCPFPASGEMCRARKCVDGQCGIYDAPKGSPCDAGICDVNENCVAHLSVVCKVNGKTYTGCDGTPPDYLFRFQAFDGSVGECGATTESVGYCAPGGSCSVLLNGIWTVGACL